jgi:hypothetical protein
MESKIFEILGIQLSADIYIFTVYSLYRGARRKERDSVVFKYINISDMNIEKIFADSTQYIIDVMHYRH